MTVLVGVIGVGWGTHVLVDTTVDASPPGMLLITSTKLSISTVMDRRREVVWP